MFMIWGYSWFTKKFLLRNLYKFSWIVLSTFLILDNLALVKKQQAQLRRPKEPSFYGKRSHKIVLLFILRMNNDTTPGIGACSVRHKAEFVSKIIKVKIQGVKTSIRIETSR